MTEAKTHSETVFRTKAPTEVSWYQPHLERSLELILRTGIGQEAHILDVGGGASTLVDDLLARGFKYITVLDVSAHALEVARSRLGKQATRVTWIEADIRQGELPSGSYDVWHDRALFHFLTNADDRQEYLDALRHALRPGGHVILATYGVSGPPRCSGLEVMRYSPERLHDELGKDFDLLETVPENHRTPFGTTQEFIYCLFRKRTA